MRQLSYLVATVALLMLVSTAGAQSEDQGVVPVPIQDARSVFIQDYFFDLADAGVAPGTTLVWFNQGDEPHTVTADDGSFDSGVLNPGDYFMVTFLGSGKVTYHCEIHPDTMVGSVTVSEDGGGGVAIDGGATEDTGMDSGY